MLLAIPVGQFYGGLIEDVVWLLFGITQSYISFDQIGLFGRFETIASFIMLGIVVALIAL
jgi:hypothetical protein